METTEQRSAEWFEQRKGKFNASAIAEVMGRTDIKKDAYDKAMNLVYQVVCERLRDVSMMDLEEREMYEKVNSTFQSNAMKWGAEHEDDARRLLSLRLGESILVDGGREREDVPLRASADGYVLNDDGTVKYVIEIKCPQSSTYVSYCDSVKDAKTLKDAQERYYWQMVAQMACYGTRQGVFAVYDPGIPSHPLHFAVITPPEEDVDALVRRVKKCQEFAEDIECGMK